MPEKSVSKLFRLMNLLNSYGEKENQELYLDLVRLLLFVSMAGKEGAIQKTAEVQLGLTNPSTSRAVSLLSTGLRKKKPDGTMYIQGGLGLLTKGENTYDGRENILQLTEKGKSLLKEMADAIS